MAESKADSVVTPCSEARQQVWIEFAMVLIPLPALLTGDLVVALMGGALAAAVDCGDPGEARWGPDHR